MTRTNARKDLGPLGWRLVWVKGGDFGNNRHNYSHLAAALVLSQKDEVDYETAKIQQEDLVPVNEQEQARACIFATSGLCIHLDSATLARYLPYIGKMLDRERCLDLVTTLSVRCQVSAEMSDQQARQFVRGGLLKRAQALQQASVVAPAAFVEAAFRYMYSHLEFHAVERVLDFITHHASPCCHVAAWGCR